MAEILLFHHAHGLTPGVLSFADELRAAGHVVHTPDLYDGHTFADLSEGVAYAQKLGPETVLGQGRAAAEGLPRGIVYAGFSFGVAPAQSLAQTRPGARGALLFHSCFPPSEFGSAAWPQRVPVQVHIMEGDQWAQEGDLDAARELAASTEDAELFVYPGDGHLFAERGSPDYDEAAAALLMERVIAFLDGID